MTYDTFKEQILAGMKARIPLASVSIQSVVKNNNVQLDGLSHYGRRHQSFADDLSELFL